jgi:hypothetical protein
MIEGKKSSAADKSEIFSFQSMIPKKLAPDLIRGGHRFLENKIPKRNVNFWLAHFALA